MPLASWSSSLIVIASIALLPTVALADEIRSTDEYIVNGSPVGEDEPAGTVRVSLVSSDLDIDAIATVELMRFGACSGVLIAPDVVLTAAHCLDPCTQGACSSTDECCVVDTAFVETAVYVTPVTPTIDDLRRTEPVRVREAIVFEDYRPYSEWTVDVVDVGECTETSGGPVCTEPGLSGAIHDIMVLRLEQPIEGVEPVRLLPDTEGLESSTGIAAGYGLRTAPGSYELLDQDAYASILHEAFTPIERVTDREILTAASDTDGGVCFGDSGGPLYVRRWSGLFVAGVASRLRVDREPPYCGQGAIYTSTAAYADWIFEVAPETVAVQSNGGGCSVSSTSPGGPSVWLLMMALWVVCVQVVRRASSGAILAAVALMCVGCGSSDEVSFCTENYDPLGVACDPSVERTDLLTASSVAADEVPPDAWLWEVTSASSILDPDGNGEIWALTYYLPNEEDPPFGSVVQVVIRGTEINSVSEPYGVEIFCAPSRTMPPFDSRNVIQDAIQRLEEAGVAVELQFPNAIGLVQNHRCASPSLRLNGVSYRTEDRIYYIGYDEFGEFIELRDEAPFDS